MSGWGTSTLANRAQIAFTHHLKSDISFHRVLKSHHCKSEP